MGRRILAKSWRPETWGGPGAVGGSAALSPACPLFSECSYFSPPTTVILLILLCFEGLLFLIFTSVMFGTQVHSICTDETVSRWPAHPLGLGRPGAGSAGRAACGTDPVRRHIPFAEIFVHTRPPPLGLVGQVTPGTGQQPWWWVPFVTGPSILP